MARIVEQQSGKFDSTGDGIQWTEEQKLEYTAKWGRFSQFIAGRTGARTGLIRRMPMVVTAIGEPETVPNTFPGAAAGSMITRRNITLETAMPGIEGLRFITSSADNVQNEKTKLHALYIAVHGEVPPKWGRFSYDLDELMHKVVEGELTYKGIRDDGKRGGMNVSLTGINMYDGETEYSHPKVGLPVEENPTPAAPKSSLPMTMATSVTPTSSPTSLTEDDDLPF